jgi:glycerophosphoryl diester phosphodiesterase
VTSNFAARSASGPLVSWHRGGSESAPSATKQAFRLAAQQGAELIEVDVRQSADGVLLCVHDPELAGLGAVRELEFLQLDHIQREEILSFEEFASVLDEIDPERRIGVHHDIKDTGYELAAVDLLAAHRRNQFVTTTFASSVALLRRERPDVLTYLTIGTSRDGLSRIGTIRLRLAETFPMWKLTRCRAQGVAVHYRLATPLLRWWCRRRGLGIVVWTVDKQHRLDEWLARDVDVVTTNRPLLALERRRHLFSDARKVT